MKSKEFTIILPTTGDRGTLLPYSVGSIQNQTIENFELFIIGDGVSENTRTIIGKLMAGDSRIRFFDHPKHERRGEVYRHQALQQAEGNNVAYLCDRDLMLPNHLETLKNILTNYNFASTTFIEVRPDQSLTIGQYIGYYGASSEAAGARNRASISLSNASHTLELYNKLPYGWRTTPKDKFTDIHMWIQFHNHHECNAYSHNEPTVLYFKRGHHPGIPVKERVKELSQWATKINTSENVEHIRNQAKGGLILEKVSLKKKLRTPVLIKGHTMNELPRKIIQKLSSRLKKL